MKFEQAIYGMNCNEVATAFHAFDRHPFVMRRGLVDSATRSADSIEHHNRREFGLLGIFFIGWSLCRWNGAGRQEKKTAQAGRRGWSSARGWGLRLGGWSSAR